MDEERRKAYLNLINALLSCPSGQEEQILKAKRDLIDAGLGETILLVAKELIEQGDLDAADFLMNLAGLIGVYGNTALQKLSSTPTSPVPKTNSQLTFLLEGLQATQDSNNNPHVVYPFLKANLGKLDDKFAQVLRSWAMATLPAVKPEQADCIAVAIGEFSILMRGFPLGDQARNLEIAITGFEVIATVFTRQAFPEKWASLQSNLGTAYIYRIRGERTENLEAAIRYYLAALEVHSRQAFPSKWAMLQNNLGNAYLQRIRGERAENLEAAIRYYFAALEIHNRQAFPKLWADSQNNLGNAYLDRIRGKRAENLEAAIRYYLAALEERTRQAFPSDWAMTQNNLGTTYCERIHGVKAENLEAAICCFKAALEVRTRQAFPSDWANTQNNLGNAYCERIHGVKAENLEAAICYFKAALEVYTRQAFPAAWANTQNNLGNAYCERFGGARAENLKVAICCYLAALEVRTRQAFPRNYARIQFNLGRAYQDARQFPDAYSAFTIAIDTVESLRGEIVSGSGTEEDKQKLAEEHNRIYQSMVEVCLELRDYAQAIEYVERSKARNLVELLAHKNLYPKRDLYPNPDIYQTHCYQLDRLRREIPAQQRELEILTRSRESEERYRNEIEQRGQELNHFQQQRGKLLREISQVDPSFTFTQKIESICFSDIQALTDDRTAIVQWYITERQILTFIITHHYPCPIVGLSSPKDLKVLEDWDKEYRDAYRQQKKQWIANLASRFQHLAEILHIDDILTRIDDIFKQQGARCDRLILIPHRYLHLFPLHALPLADGNLLLDRFPKGVGYAPSCQLLQLAQKREQHRHHFSRLLAIENPTRSNLSPLAGTKLQLEQICQHFDSDSSIILREQEATEAVLLKEQMRSPHCVHFCCHGSFNFGSPLKSALHLADPDGKLGADADLTLGKIFEKLNLEQCRLVTFSACETGIADPTSISDEYISLVSGFLYAGSPSVISTLWAVQQAATNLFMIEFYKNLKQLLPLKPGSVAIALNKTQKWLRMLTGEELGKILESPEFQRHFVDVPKNPENKLFKESLEAAKRKPFPYQNPYYWAAFVATGL